MMLRRTSKPKVAGLAVWILLFQLLPAQGYSAPGNPERIPDQKRYRPELIIQSGLTNPAESIAFSPNGSLLATASSKEVLLWDVKSGKQLRTLVTFSRSSGRGLRVNFSPDGNEIVTFKKGESVDFWNVWDGRKLRTLDCGRGCYSFDVSRDWSTVLTFKPFEGVDVWSYPSLTKKMSIGRKDLYEVLNKDDPQGTTDVSFVDFEFDADGNVSGIVSTSFRPANVPRPESDPGKWARKILLFDRSGKISRRFDGDTIAFSPDKRLMAYSKDGEFLIANSRTGEVVRTFPFKDEAGGSVAYWNRFLFFGENSRMLCGIGFTESGIPCFDIFSGKEIDTFRGAKVSVWGAGMSSDVKRIAFSGIVGGPSLEAINRGDIQDTVDMAAISKELRDVKIWDLEKGKIETVLRGSVDHYRESENDSFKIDGSKRYLGFNARTGIEIWDLRLGRPVDLGLGRDYYAGFEIDREGKRIVLGNKLNLNLTKRDENADAGFNYEEGIRMYNLADSSLIWTSREFPGLTRSLQFSPSGDKIAVLLSDELAVMSGKEDPESMRKIGILDSRTGKLLTLINKLPWAVNSVRFSPDGKLLAILYENDWVKTGERTRTFRYSEAGRTVEIRSVSNGSRLASFESGAYLPENLKRSEALRKEEITFSPDSASLAVASVMELEIWDLSALPEISLAKRIKYPNGRSPDEVSFRADGRSVLGLDIWSTGLIIFDLEADTATSLEKSERPCLDPFDKVASLGRTSVLVTPEGAAIDLLDCKTGKKKLSLVLVDKKDWAVITPSGQFDASARAMESMHFVVADPETGYEVIEFEQLKSRFYVPGLYEKILSGEAPRTADDFTITLNPEVTMRTSEDQRKVFVKATDRGGGIGRIEVRVNGSELFADLRKAGSGIRGGAGEFEFEIPPDVLVPGDNSIEVIGWNAEGDVRARGVKSVASAKGRSGEYKPKFFAIVGGISDYAGSDIDLRYAGKDAEDMALALALGANRLLCEEKSGPESDCRQVNLFLLSTNEDEQKERALGGLSRFQKLRPTKENFRKAFEAVTKAAGPGDIFVAYLAGHGVAIKSENAEEESGFGDLYLYATEDARTLDKNRLQNKSEQASMISSLELADWMKVSKAEKEVLILDTCAAGTASKDLSAVVSRDGSAEQVRALDRLRERTGFYLLMGSASDAVSYEANRFRQGLLTYTLLEAMSGAALRDGEFVDVEDWFGYAEDRVEELALEIGGVQRPSYFKSNFAKRFDIGRLDRSAQKEIPLTPPVPLISQPQILDKESLFDSIGLSARLADELKAMSVNSLRGNEPVSINFVPVISMAGSLTPSGLYEVSGDNITAEVALRSDGKTVDRIKVSGNRNDIARQLALAIIKSANAAAKQQ